MTQHTPCMICEWCLFNLKWHGRAYESLCVRAQAAKVEINP